MTKRDASKSTAKEAWLECVSPSDRIGIKVNPIAPRLPTSHELTRYASFRPRLRAGKQELMSSISNASGSKWSPHHSSMS